jgi:hypothetical protein
MKLVPFSKVTHLLVLLLVIMPVRFAFADDDKRTFFSSLDSTVQSRPGKASGNKKLIVERYLRLLARLDIFGFYCDPNNRMGYSTRVADLQRGSVRLERWTEETFGSKGAYNRFEQYRSQESLRYVQGDRARTCELGKAQFLSFTGMDPKDFRVYLSGPPFGSL